MRPGPFGRRGRGRENGSRRPAERPRMTHSETAAIRTAIAVIAVLFLAGCMSGRSWGEADGRGVGLAASPGQAHGSACRHPDGMWRVLNQHCACPWRPARRWNGGDRFNCPCTVPKFRPYPVPLRRREREPEPKAGEGGCRRGCPRPVPHSPNPGDRHARPRTRYL